MQRKSSASTNANTIIAECTFCQRNEIDSLIMKETANFRLVADYAPLLAGHLLIIPKSHYDCYGAVPATLDAELADIKQEIRRFFEHYYSDLVLWEHGVFHQTVYHAHLHCFPIGPVVYPNEETGYGQIVHSQEDIRVWFQALGHYFYLEDSQHGLLFPPDKEQYTHIVKDVLGPGVAAHSSFTHWRTPLERQLDGKPLIEVLLANWRAFQAAESGDS